MDRASSGGHFTWLKRLDHVIILNATLFSYRSFGRQHLPVLQTGVAVLVGCKDLVICFLSVEDVAYPHIQSRFSGQDLRDRHYPSTTR